MKRASYFYIIISIIFLVAFLIFVYFKSEKNIQDTEYSADNPCKTWTTNPAGEMTFADNYCTGGSCRNNCDSSGENCHGVTTREECERIDVISGNDITKIGTDGIPDCEWRDNGCWNNK